jgi:GNAT superfamily N-acetyltransferase
LSRRETALTGPYHLRDGRPDEIDAIREIERLAAARFIDIGMAWITEDEPTDAATLSERIADGRLIVIDHGGLAVAAVIFSPVDGAAYIEQIDVLPAHAGHRLAARLIDDVAIRSAALGLPRLTLSTFRDVPWNGPYYRRLGLSDMTEADLGPGHRTIRDHHRAKGLADEHRVFLQRPIRRPAL